MLRLEGVTTTDRGTPIEWFQAIYRADRVKIAVERPRGVASWWQRRGRR